MPRLRVHTAESITVPFLFVLARLLGNPRHIKPNWDTQREHAGTW